MKVTIVNKSIAVLDIASRYSFEVSSPAGLLGGPNILAPDETLKIETGRDVEFTLTDHGISIEVA